jgi:hypothetical protein
MSRRNDRIKRLREKLGDRCEACQEGEKEPPETVRRDVGAVWHVLCASCGRVVRFGIDFRGFDGGR